MAKPAEYEDMDETTYILDGRASKPAKKEWPIVSFTAGQRGPPTSIQPTSPCAHPIFASGRHARHDGRLPVRSADPRQALWNR